jgi:hypothetical protein
MNSLNVPSSWSANTAQPTHVEKQVDKSAELLREVEMKVKALDAAKADIESRDAAMRKFAASLEEKNATLDARLAEIAKFEESMVAEDEGPRKVVTIQETVTPKKSARKVKTPALDL